jgi:uncharacterized protein (DUF1697 family)
MVPRLAHHSARVTSSGAHSVTTTWVALLRGINVGRNKRIAMRDLRDVLQTLGYADVRTHLQSGNAIFSIPRRKPDAIEQEVSSRIKQAFGMEVAVMVRSAAELAGVVEANPFVARGANASELHATFLSAPPSPAKIATVDAAAGAPDEFAIGTRVIYVRLPNGVIGSRLPNWERVFGVRATTRNWNTTVRLRDLAL